VVKKNLGRLSPLFLFSRPSMEGFLINTPWKVEGKVEVEVEVDRKF